MPFDVRVEAHVARSPDDVAAYMFDPRHDPDWITGIEQVDPPAAPVAVGTETHRVARFMGRQIDYVLRVVEHIPDRLLVMESVKAPFPMGVTYAIEPEGAGRGYSLRVTGGYGLVMRLARPIVSRQIRRSLEADLRHLRRRLEARFDRETTATSRRSTMTGPMLHTVDVDSDADRIYEAITTQSGEAAFWTSDCDVEPAVGSIARFGFPSAPVDLRMQIDELSPGQRIRWSCLGDFPHWAGTSVTWALSPAPSGHGTAVAFSHDGWKADYPDEEYARVNYTWGRIVGALKAYAESEILPHSSASAKSFSVLLAHAVVGAAEGGCACCSSEPAAAN